MTQEARIQAAERVQEFLDAYDALHLQREGQFVLFSVPNTDAKLLVSDLRVLAAADAVTTLPDPASAAGSMQKMDDPYKPDEELGTYEHYVTWCDQQGLDVPTRADYDLVRPLVSAQTEVRQLRAEVRRLRAGSVSEQIGYLNWYEVNDGIPHGRWFSEEPAEDSDHLEGWILRSRPVAWVRKEDAT